MPWKQDNPGDAGCPCGVAGPPVISTPLCGCPTTPTTVHYTTVFPGPSPYTSGSGTLVYGPKPSGLAAYGLPDPGWYDATPRTDFYGDSYWRLYCAGTTTYYSMDKFYINGGFAGTSRTFFQWIGGVNPCSPWAMTTLYNPAHQMQPTATCVLTP